MLTREQFADYFNNLQPGHGMGLPGSPLWIPDPDSDCQWFVCVTPLRIGHDGPSVSKDAFWEWCNINLKGVCRCFSSDHDNLKEWWGFSDQRDVVTWLLRWR